MASISKVCLCDGRFAAAHYNYERFLREVMP